MNLLKSFVIGFIGCLPVVAVSAQDEAPAADAEAPAATEAPAAAEAPATAASTADFTVDLPNNVKLAMVKVEKGTFTMSKQDGENENNEKEHSATLTQDFYIGKTEVTQPQWEAVMGTNLNQTKGENMPAAMISWDDAMAFCKKLNELTAGKRPAGYVYNLPTETQWEFACRGGNKSKGYKYSGSDTCNDVAWNRANSGNRFHEVAQKAPNELGLYDMSGNLGEWCLDDYEPDGNAIKPEFVREGAPNGTVRIMRGGGWAFDSAFCRNSKRGYIDAANKFGILGFRLALVPEKY